VIRSTLSSVSGPSRNVSPDSLTTWKRPLTQCIFPYHKAKHQRYPNAYLIQSVLVLLSRRFDGTDPIPLSKITLKICKLLSKTLRRKVNPRKLSFHQGQNGARKEKNNHCSDGESRTTDGVDYTTIETMTSAKLIIRKVDLAIAKAGINLRVRENLTFVHRKVFLTCCLFLLISSRYLPTAFHRFK
jgi:hypothetical protein